LKAAFVAGLLAALISGCSATSAPQASAALTAAPSAIPTAARSASSAANYPYTLPWPATELRSEWRFATVQWDGAAPVDHGDKYTDYVETTDGALFAFGYRSSEPVADFRDLIARQATARHGCESKPSEEAIVSGGGEEGIFGVYNCGGQTVLRWLGVHDGFSLAVALILDPAVELAAAESGFKERIGKLTWTR
jgi:hypothetical protein